MRCLIFYLCVLILNKMENLIGRVDIKVNDKIFLKDPNSSELGKNILKEGSVLIDKIGLEKFTFKKLAQKLNTTESSIYRYFESKHKLLLYLTSYYWGFLEYMMVFSTNNLSTPEQKVRTAYQLIAQDFSKDKKFGNIELCVLKRIVISESSKAYLTKEVDDANKIGFYAGYKRLVERISDMILEMNPNFKFSHTLASTVVEGIHHQKYFAQHLPSLTDSRRNEDELADLYSDMTIGIAKK